VDGSWQRCPRLILSHHRVSRSCGPTAEFLDLFSRTEFPIVLAPMAGIMDADLVIAAAPGGALGSLPCALLSVEKAREQINIIRQRVSAPVNMNFFCPQGRRFRTPQREAGWKKRLSSYYSEHGIDPAAPITVPNRAPVRRGDVRLGRGVEAGSGQLPFRLAGAGAAGARQGGRLDRDGVRDDRARGDLARGKTAPDVIIAQGRQKPAAIAACFLTEDIANQPGLFALLPQWVEGG